MEEKKRFCTNCGKKIDQESNFCKNCGKNLNEEIIQTKTISTKKCKKCNEEINKKIKKCPKCGATQGIPTWVIVILIIIGFIFIITIADKDKSEPINYTQNGQNSSYDQQTEEKIVDPEPKIEYKNVTVDELYKDLEENAAAAKEKYQYKHLKIKGKLSTIDSDLSYISIHSINDEWKIRGVYCTLINEEQKEKVKRLKTDQIITIKGEITDVGEVLGYFLDIEEIEE